MSYETYDFMREEYNEYKFMHFNSEACENYAVKSRILLLVNTVL